MVKALSLNEIRRRFSTNDERLPVVLRRYTELTRADQFKRPKGRSRRGR